MMTAAACFLATIAATGLARLDTKVTFAFADGSVLADQQKVFAIVRTDANTAIDKVEFSVDDKLRFTDTSTPYSFDWDTLEEEEGEHTISAVAFDAQGRTTRAKVSVRVDNELSKGAAHHASAALASVKGGDRESARRSARRALKLEPKNLAAVRAMAEVFRQEKYPDKGLELLKGVEIPETDLEAQTQLASLYIAASERAPSTAAMLDFAGSAADTIHRMAVRRAASLPATASNSERGDAQFAIGNWQDAISAYQKDGPPDTAPVSTLNRLVLAYWRAGREKEAGSLLRALARYRRQDDVTRALVALETLRQYKPARARELAEAAAEDGSPAAMMVSAYANLVLNRRAEVRQWVERAKESLGESTDILLLDSLSAQDPVQSKTAVMKAIASGPGLAEGYAILGYQTMLARDAKRFEASDLLFEFAVRRDPKCGYALLGFALSLISQKRANEADTILRQLDAVEGPGPATYYTKAVHLTRQDKASIQITDYLKAAKRMDEDRWSDVFVPDLSNLIARVFQYRMPLYLTPASLYPKAAS